MTVRGRPLITFRIVASFESNSITGSVCQIVMLKFVQLKKIIQVKREDAVELLNNSDASLHTGSNMTLPEVERNIHKPFFPVMGALLQEVGP